MEDKSVNTNQQSVPETRRPVASTLAASIAADASALEKKIQKPAAPPVATQDSLIQSLTNRVVSLEARLAVIDQKLQKHGIVHAG